ncbi:MAG: hypothetical protein N3A54_00770 [Patescibacteria group bacterium]|nr:hypothetical protein [Patescibacteria group bacterium]
MREFLTELSPVDSHKDDKELFALIPFFMPKENLNMFNFLLHSFYDGVFNLSPYLMELPDYFAEFLKLNTIQGVEEASLRGIITKAFGVFIKNSPYNNTNLDDAMFNLLTRNLDADNIASIIWSMDYWKFIEQLATSIYYTFDDDHVDFNAMANMIYRVYNNNYGTFKSVNEQISFIEDDLYSVVEDSERDIIIYELNDEQNSPVPIERVRKYIDNEQFIEEMKKAESLVWLSDFFENGRIDSQSIVWEMLEGYAEHLGRIYEKEPYRSLIHLFLNIKNKKKDIKGNVALSVFLTASEKNKEVLKEFCKEFSKRAVLKNITYEHFEHPFLNECQEILSSGEEKEA